MTKAVIENFFHAVSGGKLVVTITAAKVKSPVLIDHETIDSLFHAEAVEGSNAAHYYRAIRDVEWESTPRWAPLGSLMVNVVFGEGAPRRTALVNRNGMMISDSKDLRINPLSPRGRGVWPDFAAVVMPGSDQGDLWLRSLENPSHDSLSTEQLPTEAERREANRLFKRLRSEIADIIEGLAGIEEYVNESNIDELTSMLPDLGRGADRTLLSTELAPAVAGGAGEWVDVDVTGEEIQEDIRVWDSEEWENRRDESEEDEDSDEDIDPSPGPSESGGSEGQRSAKRRRLMNMRVIPVSTTEAVLAFDSPEEACDEMSISLIPVGVDRDARISDRLTVLEAQALQGIEAPIGIEDGQITFTPALNSRVSIRVIVDGNIQQTALRVS